MLWQVEEAEQVLHIRAEGSVQTTASPVGASYNQRAIKERTHLYVHTTRWL